MVLKRNYNSKMFFENIQEYVYIHTTIINLGSAEQGLQSCFLPIGIQIVDFLIIKIPTTHSVISLDRILLTIT